MSNIYGRALWLGFLAVLAILTLRLLLASPAHADIRIGRDDGGIVREYQAKVFAAQASGERVVIAGRCASACTLYLNLPPNRICATSGASFVFHTASSAQFGLPDWRTNEALMNAYPPHVRVAISQRGGLWLNPITIRATALVRPCK